MHIAIDIDVPDNKGENISVTTGRGLTVGSASGSLTEGIADDGGCAPLIGLSGEADAESDYEGMMNGGPAPGAPFSSASISGFESDRGGDGSEDTGGPPELDDEGSPT